ncbi:MAG: PKD domain-containing protein, partial [Cyanobacteria bacterium P01_C01_bin.147]
MANQPPTAVVDADVTEGTAPLTVSFDGSGSTDDVSIASYSWDFGDEETDNGVMVSHTYTTPGTYNATLIVTDNNGLTDSATVQVIATNAQVAPTADFDFVTDGLGVDLDAASSIDDVGITGYSWDFGDGATGSGATTSHTYASPGLYTVTLTVTDGDGLTDSVSKVVSINDGTSDNSPDEETNLALLPEAELSGTVSGGRGSLEEILYDPSKDDYFVTTSWNEYGVAFDQNLGRPGPDEGFEWRVDWPTSKAINYITFGGTYPNQPQPSTLWRISYLSGGSWVTLDEGQGGWIDSGIFEWDNTDGVPITADALRVQVFSDGDNDLVSIHLRGRGGRSFGTNDSGTQTKATLIQYLPGEGTVPTADFDFVTDLLEVDFDGSGSSDDSGITGYSWDFGDGNSDSGATVSHTYGASGTYTVTLTVTDGDGLTDSISKEVEVDDGLVAPIAGFDFVTDGLGVDLDA